MGTTKATEDYLEAILMVRERRGFVRSVDVAELLSVTKPSVTYATKRLRESGHIEMAPDGGITLTESGMEIASRIYERHRLLADFLMSLGVDEETAYRDACMIEHDISETSFDALCRHAGQKREKR
ncbi:MAG TPA: DNA-binding protein [Synergistaceae bacterium]|jgi:Mn-dependent DtxR family transcriptional regulator|nr:DNA-binding protein [Synergistaceae bacterium]